MRIFPPRSFRMQNIHIRYKVENLFLCLATTLDLWRHEMKIQKQYIQLQLLPLSGRCIIHN